MSKKRFENLNRGGSNIEDSLSSFLINKEEEKETYNPLKQKRKPSSKKDKEPEAKKEQVQETKKKISVKKETQKQNPVAARIRQPAKPTPDPTETRTSTTGQKTPPTAKTSKVTSFSRPDAYVNQEQELDVQMPGDIRSRSILISEDQLNRLRRLVNYKKWKVNPKYSIQMAFFEAFSMLLSQREPIDDFPDDFVTYTPAISNEQWDELNFFVGEIKFKENDKYALKYAVYEAVEMFLQENPIEIW